MKSPEASPPGIPSPYESIAWAAELSDEVTTVDLHGLDRLEAVREVDRAINQAFMRREEALKILHGKGHGTLRREIQKHLESQTQLVAYFRDATARGQEQAMTIVVLHQR